MTLAILHGSETEARALVEAVERNCACVKYQLHPPLCNVHRMVLEDQQAVDRLLFYRWLGPRLWRQEWTGETEHLVIGKGGVIWR